MAKELDPQALVEKFTQDANKARDRVADLDVRENELAARLTSAQKKFEDATAKTRARLASVQAMKAAEQAKIDSLDAKIEWAKSMPVAANAPAVPADQEFGEATTDGEAVLADEDATV